MRIVFLVFVLLLLVDQRAVSSESESMDEVRQSIMQRCRTQMSNFGASLVKFCVDEDLQAYQALLRYNEKHLPIIERCKRQMLTIGGWNLVKFCADEDIEAERALEGY